MPENWLPYRDILLVYEMPKVTREPHGISVFCRTLRAQRNGCALIWSITSCVTFLTVRIWRATFDCLTSRGFRVCPGTLCCLKNLYFKVEFSS